MDLNCDILLYATEMQSVAATLKRKQNLMYSIWVKM